MVLDNLWICAVDVVRELAGLVGHKAVVLVGDAVARPLDTVALLVDPKRHVTDVVDPLAAALQQQRTSPSGVSAGDGVNADHAAHTVDSTIPGIAERSVIHQLDPL